MQGAPSLVELYQYTASTQAQLHEDRTHTAMAATSLAAQRTAFAGAALPCAGSSQRCISARPSLAVRSQASEKEAAAKALPRRAVAASAAAALILALSPSSSRATDVPLFGIKKSSAKSGDSSAPALPAGPDLPELSPEVQAGIVAGAEVLAVAAAGAVVSSITRNK